MSTANIFEQASRRGLRFPVGRGEASVEQLWGLDLTVLDNLYQGYKKEQKESTSSESLLSSTTRRASKASADLDLKIEILKHVVGVRLQEMEVAKAASVRREQIARLRTIQANKADEALNSASMEDIGKMLRELEAQDEAAATASA